VERLPRCVDQCLKVNINIARNANGQFAYVTIGGLNEVKVFRTGDFSQVATIPEGLLARRFAAK
jgi:hypothetical protein